MSAPRHTLVQISDVHLDAARPLYGSVDPVAALETALEAVRSMADRPEALLLTGDVANHATAADYRRARELLDPLVAELGCELVVIPGNHDTVPLLREHLLGEPASEAPMDATLRLGGLRIVALDTTIPGRHDGEVDDDQLARLARELAEPAPEGTLLLMHHTPLPSPVGLFEHVALRDPGRIAEAVRGTDVRMILSGHAHHTACGTVGGVPVWISPATSYTADVTAPAPLYRGIVGGTGITRVDVFDETVVTTLIPLAGGGTVVELDVDAVVAELADG